MLTLKHLEMSMNEYGDHKGKVTGKVTFAEKIHEYEKTSLDIVLSPEQCRDIVGILGEALIAHANEGLQSLISATHDTLLPALENDSD
jgi:hypothetical protein